MGQYSTGIRLIELAEHLLSGKLYEEYTSLHFLYSDDKKRLLIGKNDKYHLIIPQTIFELSGLFPEFKMLSNNVMIYEPLPDFGIYYGMMEFFGLKVEEFLHLFAIDCQQTIKYGGKELTIDYTHQEIANNIFEFLEIIMKQRRKNRIDGKR